MVVVESLPLHGSRFLVWTSHAAKTETKKTSTTSDSLLRLSLHCISTSALPASARPRFPAFLLLLFFHTGCCLSQFFRYAVLQTLYALCVAECFPCPATRIRRPHRLFLDSEEPPHQRRHQGHFPGLHRKAGNVRCN